jgi:hypothetical protein
VRIAWKEYFRSFFRGVGEKANRMKTYSKALRRMTGASSRFAVKLNQWAEALGSPLNRLDSRKRTSSVDFT